MVTEHEYASYPDDLAAALDQVPIGMARMLGTSDDEIEPGSVLNLIFVVPYGDGSRCVVSQLIVHTDKSTADITGGT